MNTYGKETSWWSNLFPVKRENTLLSTQERKAGVQFYSPDASTPVSASGFKIMYNFIFPRACLCGKVFIL